MRFTKGAGTLAALLILVGCASAPTHENAKQPGPEKAKSNDSVRQPPKLTEQQVLAQNLFKTAQQAAATGEYERATRDIDACLKLWPDHGAALDLRVEILRQTGDPGATEAARMAREVALIRAKRQTARREVEKLFGQARELLKEQRYNNARSCVDRALLLLRMPPLDVSDERPMLVDEANQLMAQIPR